MISRNIQTSKYFRLSTTPVRYGTNLMMPNVERWYIIQMIDTYAKLEHDETWIAIMKRFDDRIRILQIQRNDAYLNWQSAIEQREQIARTYTVDDAPLNDDETQTLDFVMAREYEFKLEYNLASNKLIEERMRMAAFLYFPLVECVKRLVNLHARRKCPGDHCEWKSSGNWDVSKVLLSIFKIYPIRIGNYDDFGRYSSHNIYLHPIIALAEHRLTRAVSAPPYMLSSRAMEAIICELSSLYDNFIVHFVVRILLNPHYQFPIETWKVWDLNGIGGRILTFLIDMKSLRQICVMYGLPLIN